MKSLNIPTRERLKGQNIRCSICYKKGKGYCATKGNDGKTLWKCKTKGKHINTCSNPESQKYISSLYNPFTKKTDIIIQHDTRDFDEFRNKHYELLNVEKKIRYLYLEGKTGEALAIINSFKKHPKKIQNEQSSKIQEERKKRSIKITPETYLETAIQIYIDFLTGKRGRQSEKRPKNDKTIDNYANTLEAFQDCLERHEYQTEFLPLKDINEDMLFDYADEVNGWKKANKTKNDYLDNVGIFFRWCTKRGAGPICNTLDNIERGKTEGDTTMISFKDFAEMITFITPENTKEVEHYTCGKTGKPRTKNKYHYKPWLADGLWLTLLMGGRGEDMAEFKWYDVFVRQEENNPDFYWIELLNFKHFKATGEKKKDFIVVYKQTYEILLKLGLKEKMGTDEYVITPDTENRKTVKRNMEDGFRHFWRLKTGKKSNKESYKTLRSTYITISENLAGSQSDLLRRHTKADVTRKHYFNKAFAVSNMCGQDFMDIKLANNS